LIAIISNLIPILISFGVMGWFGIALDTSTSMVALIALGIAIDDTIHFMIRYQRELRAVNDQQEAMARTIRTEGEPVLFTSLALAMGFAVIMGSSFVPSIYFGGLSALVMVTALLTDLFVNPVLLLTVQLITLWDYVWLRFKKTVLEKSRIFKDLRYSEAKKVVLLGSIQRADAREVVCRQGEAAEEMYLAPAGRLDVILETPTGHRKSLGKL
ncbi:MAG: MMPL family transporter, partial [Desulfobacterales bacterium]|nr:MMPL family transporter [Desulfobacterales bacterium]